MSSSKKNKKKLSRRSFLVRGALGTAGVLALGTYVLRNPIRRQVASFIDTADAPFVGNTDTPVVWFEITKDNNVILYSPKVEMGQGTFTGLAQMAADELEVSMAQMRVVHADSASGNVDSFATGGSTSISSLWMPLRELAATMREMIKTEAAKKLKVSVFELLVTEGIISGSQKQLTYAEAITGVKTWKVPDTPKLKSTTRYKYVGKPVPRVDLQDKVFGVPIFGMDATLPNMLHGAIVRSGRIGATYVDADTTKAEHMPGVIKIVKEKDFVGVVARSYVEAHNAKKAIEAHWEVGQKWSTADIEHLVRVGKGQDFIIQKEGNPASVLEDDTDTITAEYWSPIGAHAQLEPTGALAYVEQNKATILISTQVVGLTRSEIAERIGFDKEKVNIVPTFLGGGFGRRLHTPNGIQAAVLSKAVGQPVKCFFTRKEEFQNDTFRPPTNHLMRGKLTNAGRIEALEHNVSSGDVAFGSPIVPRFAEPILGADLGAWRGGMIQYAGIKNYQAISWRVKLPFATSWWRSLGLLANTFAIESFMDELAVKAKNHPVEFRLMHIKEDKRGHRLKSVIKAVAEKSGYRDEVVGGRAMGLAVSTDTNTPCAQVAEVSIHQGEIKVHKVTCAIDPGLVINPDQVRAQCEGAIIMGISAALHEKMEVVDGVLTPTIYGPYQMALMKHAPKEIDVVLLEGSDKPGAVGEPPLGPIGAAIANAVFRLTGERFRRMPMQLMSK